jgi:hypothetical protein
VAASKPKALGMVNLPVAIPKLRLRLPPNYEKTTYKFILKKIFNLEFVSWN